MISLAKGLGRNKFCSFLLKMCSAQFMFSGVTHWIAKPTSALFFLVTNQRQSPGNVCSTLAAGRERISAEIRGARYGNHVTACSQRGPPGNL